ncbi:hypothetical protein CR513_53831, partial [Mucuna pruriens]
MLNLLNTPMGPNVKLLTNYRELLLDLGRYKRLVGKLNYLSHSLDISFGVHRWDVVIWIVKYNKSALGKGLIYEDICLAQIVGYSHVDWAGSPSDWRSTSGTLWQDHWDVVIWIVKYIKSALGKGLIYEDIGLAQIVGYSHADWAS